MPPDAVNEMRGGRTKIGKCIQAGLRELISNLLNLGSIVRQLLYELRQFLVTKFLIITTAKKKEEKNIRLMNPLAVPSLILSL